MGVLWPGQTVVRTGGAFDHFSMAMGDEGHIIERAVIVHIMKNISARIDALEVIWKERDVQFAADTGTPDTYTPIERVDKANYFVGARPSLIATPLNFWPSITARTADSTGARDQGDQYDIVNTELYIEVLSKYGPVAQDEIQLQPGIDAEGEVNKQVRRLAAAVHDCIRLDPSLGGKSMTVFTPPTKRPSFPAALPGADRERAGDFYVFQGMQLRYTVQMLSV